MTTAIERVEKWARVDVHHEDLADVLRLAKLGARVEPDDIKVIVCECLIAVNDEYAHPIIPPTAINWIGDRLASALLAWIKDGETPWLAWIEDGEA